MKHVKIIGLAALAVMAFMAVAASSASASAKVCSTEGTGTACEAGHGKVYNGTIKATVLSPGAVLTATNSSGVSVATVTCTGSEAEGQVTNGATGTGNITKLTFTGCSSPSCETVTASSSASAASPWPATATTTIPGTSNTNGIMDVTNPTGSFVCRQFFIPVTCKFKTSSAQVHITGSDSPEGARMVATNVALSIEEGPESLCGAKADWSATYKVVTPKTLMIE
jgi:hypothetical protein